jgi:sugar phosphate isomerase/epimerase
MAEKNNVVIALELGRLDLVFYVEEFRRLQDEVGSSVLKINFDPANLIKGRLDPIAVAKELVDDVVHVHMKDANRDRMCPLTKGDVDFIRMIEILEANGYQGNYVLEQEHTEVDRTRAVAEDFENLMNLLYQR